MKRDDILPFLRWRLSTLKPPTTAAELVYRCSVEGVAYSSVPLRLCPALVGFRKRIHKERIALAEMVLAERLAERAA
jgi:hypothetical protein